jgi:hypothetical protein
LWRDSTFNGVFRDRLSADPGRAGPIRDDAVMDPGLEAALYYGDLVVTEEVRYEQDGPHSPLVVHDLGHDWEVSCACGYTVRATPFELALLIAEGHLDSA